ncbi:MAG: hypothetical protein P8049_02140 [Gemmatimonadota bacterium]
MARRSNYTYEKRQKEIRKAKKKEAKAEKKRLRKEASAAGLENLSGMGVEELEAALERVQNIDDGDMSDDKYQGDEDEETVD